MVPRNKPYLPLKKQIYIYITSWWHAPFVPSIQRPKKNIVRFEGKKKNNIH